jgi:putative DNA primase/helicase
MTKRGSVLSNAGTSKRERPTIVLKTGKLPRVVHQAEDALVGRCEELRIFQRGGELVRIIFLPQRRDDKKLCRPRGGAQLESLSNTALTDIFNRIVRWKKRTNSGDTILADCPSKIAGTYISRTGAWRVPLLTGIISAPIVRKDGTVLDRPGYDIATGLYLGSDENWATIPQRPTREDAKAAIRILLEPFAEFPFVRNEDRSVHAACILTAIQRRLLGACPIFGYSAPAQRSGKSLLAESVAIIATEKPAPATAISADREEIRKMITSALREGHSIINLDNVEHPLGSPDLAKAITQDEYQDRALGENRMLRLLTNVLWTATGNNLIFRGDMSSRALLCRIDALVESPESRRFKIPQLVDHLRTNRKHLVGAALTILRAYRAAGSPRQQVQPWGGFDDWSASIREPLVWIGMADPCQTRTFVLADDPEREESLAALRALREVFRDTEFTTKQILDRCESDAALRTSILTVAAARQEIDSRHLGWWLRRVRDRVIGGLRVESLRKVSGVACWRVVKARGGHGGHGGQLRAGPDGVYRFPRLADNEEEDRENTKYKVGAE